MANDNAQRAKQSEKHYEENITWRVVRNHTEDLPSNKNSCKVSRENEFQTHRFFHLRCM
jgi:hypothetical protein